MHGTRRTYGAGYSDARPIPVRLRADQREAIEEAAEAAGMPASAWIREVALIAAGRRDLTDWSRGVEGR